GFVVLHPLKGVAGQAVDIEHVDGSKVKSKFPELVNPIQPVLNIRSLTHEAGHDLVSQRTDVQHRLDRIHQFRELAFYLAAVDMLDIDCLSRHALEGMEHHEAG